MQEQRIKSQQTTKDKVGRTIAVFLDAQLSTLAGDWQWEMISDHVFCSDVMLPFPSDVAGVKGIIHPEDVAELKRQINNDDLGHLEFRIITTYGEIKHITGTNIQFKLSEPKGLVQQQMLQKATEELQYRRRFDNWDLEKTTFEQSEKLTGVGSFFYNTSTCETWYSDQVYRIFDLPPQSLNAHFKTFHSFIHPDDREQVVEFIDRSIKERKPLFLEFRIITALGEKNIQYNSHWFKSSKGEVVIAGNYQDITQLRISERTLEQTSAKVDFYKQQVAFDEQHVLLGHWQISLVTRKTTISNSTYQIFGIKANQGSHNIQTLLTCVHPADYDVVASAYKKMLTERTLPELQFRIVRPDGKTRYVTQKAKLLSVDDDLILAATIQDITVLKHYENKVAQLKKEQSFANYSRIATEEMTGTATWIWDLSDGTIKWSENFYRLLGYKPNTIELTQKIFISFIHPEDKENFIHHRDLFLKTKEQAESTFRIVRRGEVRHMKAFFHFVKDADNNLFIAAIRDITEKNLLQQQALEKWQLAEAVCENIIDRLIITDLNNTILHWNKECERVYKISAEDAIGQNFFDIFPSLKTDEEIKLFNRVLKGEHVYLPLSKSQLGNGHFELHMLPYWNTSKDEVIGIIHIIHDLTKETELRRNLNERLTFIESIVDSSVDRIIALDSNMNYLVWNKKCEEYYGLKKQQVLGKNVLEVFPSTKDTPTYEQFKRALRGETIHIPANMDAGKEHYHEIYLLPVKNETNEIIAVLWVLHDLSKDYQLVQQQLKTNEIINALDEIYFELDDQFRFVYLNEKAVDWVGKNKAELNGELFWKIFPDLEHTTLVNSMIKAMEEGVSSRQEVFLTETNSWLLASVAPTVEGIVIVFYNIDELKKVQEKLEESSYFLGQINSATPDAVTVYDIRNRIPLYLNDKLAQWIGTTNEQLLEMGFEGRLAFIHPDYREKVINFNRSIQAIDDDTILSVVYRINTLSGQTIWVHNRSKVFQRNEEGEVTHILSILQDISEQVLAETMLMQLNGSLEAKNKELQQKNDEITSFAFIASHDLKEPIRKIHTFSDMLIQKENDRLSDYGKNLLEKITNAVTRMDNLLRDISVLTRIQRETSKPIKVDLNKILEEIKNELQDDISKKQAQINTTPLPTIKGIPAQLKYLFRNLISNSLKFQSDGNIPKITIETKLVTGEEAGAKELSDSFMCVTFNDNGIGFDEMYKKKIFEMFQRLHNHKDYPGTGMGLAICRKVMENHGGYITVDSTPGQGTTFCCFFPA